MAGQEARGASVRATVAALGGLVGFLLVYALAVLTATGQRFEDLVLDAASYAATSDLLGLVSVPALALVCVVIVAIGLIRRRWLAAGSALVLMIMANVSGQLLKYVVLQRPVLVSNDDNTLPSGHTIAYASALIAILIVVPSLVRLLLTPLVVLVLGLVGGQLVHLGWHRPSDVVCGLLLVGSVASLVMAFPRSRTPSRPGLERTASRVLYRSLMILAGLCWLAVVVAALAYIAEVSDPTVRLPLVFGYGLILGTVLLVAAVPLWITDGGAAMRVRAAEGDNLGSWPVSGKSPTSST